MLQPLLDAALVGLVFSHLAIAPYTKVEESFSMQAVHDILNLGVYPSSVLAAYDHTSFPGAVPRTFVGSAILASVVRLIDLVYTQFTGLSLLVDGKLGQLHVQMVVRAVLGVFNVLGFYSLRRALVKITPRSRATVASWAFTFLLLGQFHVMFYASRTLPNFMVLPLVNFAVAKIVVGDLSGLTWLAMCGAIFRVEVGVFGAVVAFTSSLVFGASNVFQNAFLMMVGGLVGLAVSYAVDSYFWQTPIVPELQSFLFNVVSGNASKWGVEPYGAYFSKYIPAFFRPPHVLFLALFGFFRDPVAEYAPPAKSGPETVVHPALGSLRVLLVSSILFVLTMSFQPHKEWRFIVYVVPIVTVLAANGLSAVWANRARSFAHKLLVWFMVASAFVSVAISLFMSYASSYNYPGGNAMSVFLQNAPQSPFSVHMDVPACMTGITKFTELHGASVFDKTEEEGPLSEKWGSFDYLITHVDMDSSPSERYNPETWQRLYAVPSFAGVNVIGGLQSVNSLRDPKSRSSLLRAIWTDLKAGQFSTLDLFLRRSLFLKDAMFIYKRVEERTG